MSLRIRHATSPAKPGPARDRPPAPAPPPPPRWRAWLFPIGLAATILLLFVPRRPRPPRPTAYTYTKFLSAGRRQEGPHGLDQPQRCHHRGAQEGRRLHEPDPRRHQRHLAGAHAEEPTG